MTVNYIHCANSLTVLYQTDAVAWNYFNAVTEVGKLEHHEFFLRALNCNYVSVPGHVIMAE